jgi:hypothetical protein
MCATPASATERTVREPKDYQRVQALVALWAAARLHATTTKRSNVLNKLSVIGLLVVALGVGGCATVDTKDIEINTEADPKANFAGYKSYTWLGTAAILFDDAGKWEPPNFDADSQVEFLINRELRKRGMSEDSVSPDMLVAYAAGIDMDSLRAKVDPESNIVSLQNVPEGALLLILIDAETGVAIWAGLATAEVKDNPDSETVKGRLDYAVTSMLAKLSK